MPMFFFMFKIRPTLTNPEYAQVSGGMASLFVLADDSAEASRRAVEHVTKAAWEIIGTEMTGGVDKEGCTTWEQEALYAKAESFGIACCYNLGHGGAPKFN